MPYRLRLHFAVPRGSEDKPRVFDVDVAGQAKIGNVTLGGQHATSLVREVDRVMLGYWLDLKFEARQGSAVLCGIELERLPE